MKTLSHDASGNENMRVQGDNPDALKVLSPAHPRKANRNYELQTVSNNSQFLQTGHLLIRT